MPKLPSISHLWNSAVAVCRRFPIEILFALTGVIAGTVLIEVQSHRLPAESWCRRIIMMANLGLLLSLSATLLSESRLFSATKKWAFRILAVAVAIAFLLLLNPAKQETDNVRFVLLSMAFHLLVSFVAFNRKAGINAFWQFNKTLFLRFLSGALYSAVLFAGLSAAIGSMNLLFGFDFEWDTFVILWTWIVGLFLTVFFLAGVPRNIDALENETTYPKGLKVFTQYVLIPLATVYVVILLAYELKILIQWNLPKGLVSNLILGYAVFGILSLLLVFPIRNEEGNKWIRTYSRSFYLLLLPLIVLLIVAVLFRILPYGITVPRYFLLVLAGWLTIITFYFLFSREQNIRIIPVSLAIFTLLTVYGPQGAFSVAKTSQISVLKSLFKKYGAFDGKYLKPLNPGKIDSVGKERIRNVAEYVVKEFGLESLQGMMKPDLKRVSDSLLATNKNNNERWYSLRYQQQLWVQKQLNIPSSFAAATFNDHTRVFCESNSNDLFETQNARFFLPFFNEISARVDGRRIKVNYNEGDNYVLIRYGTLERKVDLQVLVDHLPIQPKDKSGSSFKIPQKLMTSFITVDKLKIVIYWTNLNYEILPDKRKVPVFARGYLLIK